VLQVWEGFKSDVAGEMPPGTAPSSVPISKVRKQGDLDDFYYK
jgi:hypothetical protein